MKLRPTPKELNRLFDWQSQPGKLIRKTNITHNAKIGDVAGTFCASTGRRHVSVNGTIILLSIVIFVCKNGYWPEHDVDHIDQDKTNDHPDNLEEKTRQCNLRNVDNVCTNTSGVKGVIWDNFTGRWRAQLSLNNHCRSLGRYDSFDNAVCARLAGEQCLDWEGCNKCSPAYRYVRDHIQNKI